MGIAALPGGFTVVAGVATIVQLDPNAGTQGQNLTVIVSGAFTNFTQGATTASFGPGIAVGTVTVNGPTLVLGANCDRHGGDAGTRTITLVTGSESASIANGFTVLQGTPRSRRSVRTWGVRTRPFQS